MAKYLCPTPPQYCSGAGLGQASFSIRHIEKAHSSSAEAFRCYARYLVRVLGCERLGPREFRHPRGKCNVCGWTGDESLDKCPECGMFVGAVEVLTKQSRFGHRLRKGKGGEKGTRAMPNKRTGGAVVG